MSIEQRLKELGLTLPQVGGPLQAARQNKNTIRAVQTADFGIGRIYV